MQISLTKIKISGARISYVDTFNHYFTSTVLHFIANVNIELSIILSPIIEKNNLGLLFDLGFVWMYLSTASTGYWIIYNKNKVELEYYGYKR